jgi:hypothetical protein
MSDAQQMERFFRERGFGQLIGWGDNPGLLVIDDAAQQSECRAFSLPAQEDPSHLRRVQQIL